MSTPSPEALTPQEAMFAEAVAAVQAGNRTHARDLLTRLLKTVQDNADFWVWMSAVVETPKERLFCLKEALKLDPQNTSARTGLVLMGALPAEPDLVLPPHLQQRNWQSKVAMLASGELPPVRTPASFIMMGAALVVVVGLIAFAIFGMQRRQRIAVPTIFFPSETAVLSAAATPTARPKLTGSPGPLWAQLQTTYTPTPMYVNTPHGNSEAYRIGMRSFWRQDWKNAQTYLQQVATVEPGSADILFYLGETYRMQGEYLQAMGIFNQLVEQKPDFAPGYLGRSRVWIAEDPKNLAAALKDMQTAIQKDANYGEAYLGLAALQIQAADNEQALATLDQAAMLLPDSPLLYLYRAQAALALNDSALALQNARRANELDMTLLPAYRMIGQALQTEGDLPGSIAPLTTYILYKTDDAQAWAWLAKAQLYQKNTKDALKALDQSLRLDNHQEEAYLLRAQILLDSGRADSALNDYKAAQRLDSTSYQANLGIGAALMALNYPGDAYVQFERTRTLAKEDLQNAEVIFWRAKALEKLGQLEVAQRDYQALVAKPAASVKDEWAAFAKARLAAIALLTPSATPKTPTLTMTVTATRQPTRTRTPTATPAPSRTPSPSPTMKPTKTPAPTATTTKVK